MAAAVRSPSSRARASSRAPHTPAIWRSHSRTSPPGAAFPSSSRPRSTRRTGPPGTSFRGPGLEAGLRTLADVKARTGLPILTDIHEPAQAAAAAEVVDVIQIPAFLSRQTDLIVAAARTGKVVNIKKGQFLAPKDMRHVIAKIAAEGNESILVTERGVSFGYNNLVVDMRAFPMLRELGYPVVFDVTHSLQLPGAGDGVTAGLAEYIEPLASAGVAAGVDAVFMEVHEEPARARSDAANALRLDKLEALLLKLKR